MNEFKNKLTNLRLGAKNVVKGTIANMKGGMDGSAYKKIDDAKRAKNEGMIRDNFGSEDNYQRNFAGKGIPKPGVLGKFASKLINMRNK